MLSQCGSQLTLRIVLQVLRELLPEVLVLPADELYPDCVFVEDAVVVCDGTTP